MIGSTPKRTLEVSFDRLAVDDAVRVRALLNTEGPKRIEAHLPSSVGQRGSHRW